MVCAQCKELDHAEEIHLHTYLQSSVPCWLARRAGVMFLLTVVPSALSYERLRFIVNTGLNDK